MKQHFTLVVVSIDITVIYGALKSHKKLKSVKESTKENVWCALGKDRIIGPFSFEGHVVNRESYLEMLQNYFIPELTHLGPTGDTVFQQNGAPCHFALSVRQFLNESVSNRWIGIDGPISWPPRSPDLSPLDFFLWGHVIRLLFIRQNLAL